MRGARTGAPEPRSSDLGAPAERWSWASPRRVLAFAAVASAAWTAALARTGWFYYDDFWNLTVAHDLGWGWDLLGRPVFGHVTPGANALIGLVAGPGGFGYGWAVATLAVLAGVIPVAAAAAARSLGARPWPAVVAGVAACCSAGLAAGSGWWSAGLNAYPSMLAGMGLLVGAGAAREGRRWGAPAAALALGVGMACSEAAAVFVLVPVVLALGVGTGPWRQRLAGACGGLRGWAVLAIPFVGAAVVRASASGPVEGSPRAPFVDLATFPVVFAVKGFGPALVGLTYGRVELLGSAGLTTLAGVAGLLVAWWALRGRLRAGFGWAVAAVAVVVLARGALVAWSRLALLGWSDAVEARYLADVAWLVPVVVAAGWRRRPRPGGGPTPAAPVLVAAFCLLGLAGQAAVIAGGPARDSRRYRDELAASWAAQPAGTTVVDALVPAQVLGPQFGEFLFLSRTVARGGLDLSFAPSDRLVAPDEQGRLRPVRLGPLAELRPAEAFTAVGEPGVRHVDGCWEAGDDAALVWVPLTRPVLQGPWVLDLALSGRSDPSVGFVAAGTAPSRAIGASAQGRGDRRWLVSAVPFAASQLGFSLPAGSRLCLAAGAVTAIDGAS